MSEREPERDQSAEQVEAGEGVNLAVLAGRCSAGVEVRVLESGTRVASLSVRVPSDSGAHTSVPVTVWEPKAWVEELAEGDELLVVGSVRRRFYRTTGGTGARVDVEAAFVGRVTNRRQRDAALRRAERALELLAG
jgi:single-strand DNA-binding protein